MTSGWQSLTLPGDSLKIGVVDRNKGKSWNQTWRLLKWLLFSCSQMNTRLFGESLKSTGKWKKENSIQGCVIIIIRTCVRGSPSQRSGERMVRCPKTRVNNDSYISFVSLHTQMGAEGEIYLLECLRQVKRRQSTSWFHFPQSLLRPISHSLNFLSLHLFPRLCFWLLNYLLFTEGGQIHRRQILQINQLGDLYTTQKLRISIIQSKVCFCYTRSWIL